MAMQNSLENLVDLVAPASDRCPGAAINSTSIFKSFFGLGISLGGGFFPP